MAEHTRFRSVAVQAEEARSAASEAADEVAARVAMHIVEAAATPAADDPRKIACRRDAYGRFSRTRPRRGPPRRPRVGRRGPSYLADKTQAALIRICVDLEHRVGRLEAERERREWRDPVVVAPARMDGIRRWQADGQARRLNALEEVLIDMSEARLPADMPKRHQVIAERMCVRLKENFHWRTLYTAPFRSRWLEAARILDDHPADASALAADRARWSKPLLVYRIGRLMRRRDELLSIMAGRLLAESQAESGWKPIRSR